MSDELYEGFLVEKPGGRRRRVVEPLEVPTLDDVLGAGAIEQATERPLVSEEQPTKAEPVAISAEEYAKAMGFEMPEEPST